jgi:general secretion pathway protein K
MALMPTLWCSALLLMLASALAATSLSVAKLVRSTEFSAQADALIERVMTEIAMDLVDPQKASARLGSGVSKNVDVEGIIALVTIEDELGRIDLNHAPRPLLEALFRQAQLSDGEAASLTERLLQWREGRSRMDGIAVSPPAAAAAATNATTRPFLIVDELKRFPGASEALFETVRGALTVYSGRPMIDPQLASDLALRAYSDAVGTTRVAPPVPPNAPMDLSGRALRIQIKFTLQNRVVRRETVIRVLGSAKRVYWVLNERASRNDKS